MLCFVQVRKEVGSRRAANCKQRERERLKMQLKAESQENESAEEEEMRNGG